MKVVILAGGLGKECLKLQRHSKAYGKNFK